jgi:hypothetical protein
MDNNPFRSQQTPQTGNSNGYIQPGQQQPYYNNNLGYSQPQNGYHPQPQPQQQQQQQQQQPWQYQQPQSTNMNPQLTSYSTLPQTTYSAAPATGAPPSQYSPYSAHNSSLMPSTNSSMSSFGNTYPPFGVQQNTALPTSNNDSMYNTNLMGYQQQQLQYHQPQQPYNPNNFYIPPDFGVSSNNNNNNNNNNSMFQPQQPKHAPVDASTLLKGTQVRRVECPVCQKMIEGDDMAVNHHVNEHYQ